MEEEEEEEEEEGEGEEEEGLTLHRGNMVSPLLVSDYASSRISTVPGRMTCPQCGYQSDREGVPFLLVCIPCGTPWHPDPRGGSTERKEEEEIIQQA